jgi:hypothetical protein
MSKLLQYAMGAGMATAARHSYHRFTEVTKRAQAVNDRLLASLLHLNQATEYGQRYRFETLRTATDFKAALPLTSYADYQDYIDRMADGQQNVLTAEPVRHFSLSSGTTGRQKLIAATPRTLRSAAGAMSLLTTGILQSHLADRWHYGRGLNLMNMVIAGRTSGGIVKSAGTAGGMRSMGWLIPLLWTSPIEMLQSAEDIDAPYLHLLFALMEENLAYLCAPFISPIFDLLRRMEQDWTQLVDDVAAGTINPAVRVPPGGRAALQQQLRPNPQRAAALSSAFKQGFDGIVRRIWPHLLYIGGATGGSFSMYAERIKTYTGSLPLYSGCYAASEGLMGISLRMNKPTYVLIPGGAYFEFIPLRDVEQAQPETLSLSQLVIGESYEIILSSYAGLYRYRLADIVRVVSYYQNSPEVEFLYRRNQLLSLVAEKTSEQAAQRAVQMTFSHLPCQVIDFAVTADLDLLPGRYVFFIEVEGDHLQQWAGWAQEQLDHQLGLANPSYGSARRSGRISPLDLQIVQPGTFADLKTLMMARGASPNQLKIPRVIEDKQLRQHLATRVIPVLPKAQNPVTDIML